MKRLLLIRTTHHPKATLGWLFVLNGNTEVFKCASLELPWKDNLRGISRIPEGTYPLEYEHSPRFRKNLWELKKVPGRSEVKIHVANYARQLEGCIAVGNNHKDIDSDGIPDVTNSRAALIELHRALKDTQAGTTITILNGHELT